MHRTSKLWHMPIVFQVLMVWYIKYMRFDIFLVYLVVYHQLYCARTTVNTFDSGSDGCGSQQWHNHNFNRKHHPAALDGWWVNGER